jgi:murein DD-endopeptidase MepM/ murein hydrolase activator NlpD
MRGKLGGPVDTSAAAAQATTTKRPAPDGRGVISYPSYQVAVARRGDTITTLSQRLGLDPNSVAIYNGIDLNADLGRGDLIALPNRVSESETAALPAAPGVDVTALAGSAIDRAASTTPAGTTGSEGLEPIRHQVARGETAFSIARSYNVSPRSLAEWNNLDRAFTIREGQYLLIPVIAEQAPVEVVTPAPGQGSVTPTPPSASAPLPTENPAPTKPARPAATPDKPVADIGQQTTKSKAAMSMPVSGNIIREFSKGKNNGIDIAAAAGTPVKAAASGKVASISSTTEGVNFLLVRHPGDLITVYTHLDEISVKKGDAISRGQTLGKVQAGDPSFLHFEVRKGFESTDPMAYLQ